MIQPRTSLRKGPKMYALKDPVGDIPLWYTDSAIPFLFCASLKWIPITVSEEVFATWTRRSQPPRIARQFLASGNFPRVELWGPSFGPIDCIPTFASDVAPDQCS